MKTLRVSSGSESPVVPSITADTTAPLNPHPAKLLELTPLWEQVTRTGALPPDTDTSMVFTELGSRLRDPEWEVRQHGLRVLTDLVPVLGARRLDLCLPTVLTELVSNLGHPSAAVRKGAVDTLKACVHASSSPDSVLRAVVARTNSDDRSVSMGVVLHIPTLLDDRISQQTLAIIVGALAKKLVQVSFQEQALKSLVRIKEMIGEQQFSSFLEKFHPECKRDFEILCQVYEIGEYLSDSGIDLQYPGPGPPAGWSEDDPEDAYESSQSRSRSSEERSRSSTDRSHGSEDDFESSEGEIDARRQNERPQQQPVRPQTSVPTQSIRPKSGVVNVERPQSSMSLTSRPASSKSRPASGRVVLETEIKFNEQTAITMTILEEDDEERAYSVSSGDMASSDIEEDGMFIKGSSDAPQTPQRKESTRRVRFAGEEVLKTPPGSAMQRPKSKLENNEDQSLKKPSLIPIRIPTDGEPPIKPVKPPPKLFVRNYQNGVIKNGSITYSSKLSPFYESKPQHFSFETSTDDTDNGDSAVTKTQQSNETQSKEISPETGEKDEKPKDITPHMDQEVPINANPRPLIETPRVEVTTATVVVESAIPERVRGRIKDRDSPIPSLDGGDSLTGSSDCEKEDAAKKLQPPEVEEERVASALASLGEIEREAGDAAASWEDLSIVDASVMEDLRDREDWRARVRGAQQLKAALRNSAAIERLKEHLPEFLTFLDSLLEDSSPRVVGATLGTYARLAEALGERLRPHVRHIASAVCRPAASSRAEVKMEAAHATKALMQGIGAHHVTEALADNIKARNHRQRESALQLVILGLLTFPSCEFDAPELASRVMPSLADTKRRVRQAALDCTAVLAQFLHPSALPIHLAAERLRSKQSQEALNAAVSARLARRVLPAVSPEGLILYSVQVPNHAARGLSGSPVGADVEWILAGSGSTSPGSARSRAQLFAAARRGSSEDSLPGDSASLPVHLSAAARAQRAETRGNWRGQAEKNEEQMIAVGVGVDRPRGGAGVGEGPPSSQDDENVTWTLLPVGALQDEQGSRLGLGPNPGPLWTAEFAKDPVQGPGGDYQPMYLRLLRRQPEQMGNLDRDKGYILLPSKQLASTLGRGSGENMHPSHPPATSRSPSPAVRGGRRVLEPIRSPETKGAGESREERTSPIPLRPTLARSSSNERRKMPPLSRDPASPSGSSVEDQDSEDYLARPSPRSPSLRRSRRERRERANTGPSAVSHPVRNSPQLVQREVDIDILRRGTPPDSPSGQPRNPLPQKPVLARNLNNNNNNNNNTLSRVGVGSPLIHGDKSDNVSLVEVVPIDVALDLLGGHTSRSGSADEHGKKKRFFPSVDNTPPALGSPINSPPLLPRGPFFSTPAIDDMTPIRPSHGSAIEEVDGVSEEVQPAKTLFSSNSNSKPTTSLHSAHSTPQRSVSGSRASGSPPLHSSLPANLLEVEALSHPSRVPSPTSQHEVQGAEAGVTETHTETEDGFVGEDNMTNNNFSTSPITGVVAKPLPPRARPTRKSMNITRDSRRSHHTSLPRQRSSSSSVNSSSSSLYGDGNAQPFRKPHEALVECQLQLDNQEWETVIKGLEKLVRLTRHHPDVLVGDLHAVVGALVRQVRNLRSQVSRAACQAAGEMAVALKRSLDNELEELVSPLLHRSADTNRFLRDDCGKALDKVMENLPPTKAISAIISQGGSHKNALVRTTTARLLCGSVTKMGGEKVMTTLNRDVRVRLLRTAAGYLTEGSLDTRTWAKKIFAVLLTYQGFEQVVESAVGGSVMRNIEKILANIRRDL